MDILLLNFSSLASNKSMGRHFMGWDEVINVNIRI